MSSAQEFIGCKVYSRDGRIIGEVEGSLCGGKLVVIRRSLFSRLVAPMHVIDASGGDLTIHRPSTFLDRAPKVKAKSGLSEEDAARIEAFFTTEDV